MALLNRFNFSQFPTLAAQLARLATRGLPAPQAHREQQGAQAQLVQPARAQPERPEPLVRKELLE